MGSEDVLEQASPVLDQQAHLLIYSGRLSVAVDTVGLWAAASSNTRNLFHKLGVPPEGSSSTPAEVYDALSDSETNITITLSGCTSANDDATYTLCVADDAFVRAGLVRQGHAVTQVTVSALEFQHAVSGAVSGSCAHFVGEADPKVPCHQDGSDPACRVRCNQDTGRSWPCVGGNPDRTVAEGSTVCTECVGFVQGSIWERCFSESTTGKNNLQGELSVWGDSIVFEPSWDAAFELPDGCLAPSL